MALQSYVPSADSTLDQSTALRRTQDVLVWTTWSKPRPALIASISTPKIERGVGLGVTVGGIAVCVAVAVAMDIAVDVAVTVAVSVIGND